MSLILTKAALALKIPEINFQVVKYESYKPKKKSNIDKEEDLRKVNPVKHKELELKKIRHEVVKLGMSGFSGSKKEEAKIALAVSLGAKPPKKEYVNYKELMAKRKEEIQKVKEEKQLMVSKSVMQTAGKKKKKTGNDVGHLLDSYGKVKKKDLKKDEKSVSKKKKKK